MLCYSCPAARPITQLKGVRSSHVRRPLVCVTHLITHILNAACSAEIKQLEN